MLGKKGVSQIIQQVNNMCLDGVSTPLSLLYSIFKTAPLASCILHCKLIICEGSCPLTKKNLHVILLFRNDKRKFWRCYFCAIAVALYNIPRLIMHDLLKWKIYYRKCFCYLRHSILTVKEYDMALFVNKWSIISAIHHVKV